MLTIVQNEFSPVLSQVFGQALPQVVYSALGPQFGWASAVEGIAFLQWACKKNFPLMKDFNHLLTNDWVQYQSED